MNQKSFSDQLISDLKTLSVVFPILRLISENITYWAFSKIIFSIGNSTSIILSVNIRVYQYFFPILGLISKHINHREFMKIKQFRGHPSVLRWKIPVFEFNTVLTLFLNKSSRNFDIFLSWNFQNSELIPPVKSGGKKNMSLSINSKLAENSVAWELTWHSEAKTLKRLKNLTFVKIS